MTVDMVYALDNPKTIHVQVGDMADPEYFLLVTVYMEYGYGLT